jgi:Ca2+-binding RTX toxin-like protein
MLRRTSLLLCLLVVLTASLASFAVAATKVGRAGNDRLVGTPSADKLFGRGGNDDLRGRSGNDVLVGGAGNDTLLGGSGKDVLSGGPGTDVYAGGKGNDVIYANDGVPERISCGPGIDTVRADPNDVVAADCERRG